jgi:hypothetical protein
MRVAGLGTLRDAREIERAPQIDACLVALTGTAGGFLG